LSRLGGPNFHEIPINRPLAPVHNNQRDGHMRQTINAGKSSYHPNTIGDGDPSQAKSKEGGFVSCHERIDAQKVRARSQSFLTILSRQSKSVSLLHKLIKTINPITPDLFQMVLKGFERTLTKKCKMEKRNTANGKGVENQTPEKRPIEDKSNPDGQDPVNHVAFEQIEKDLNSKILEITMRIMEHYPELSHYLEEMPVTVPTESDPEITLNQLRSYYDSLNSLLNKYEEEYIRKTKNKH
jgi:hypothetical protein